MKCLLVILTVYLVACSNSNQPNDGKKLNDLMDSLVTEVSDSMITDTFANFSSDTIVPPYQYTILQEAEGDLDKDGIKEKVVVYNTSIETDFGTKRVLKIYKFIDLHWVEFGACYNCILPSENGGMMGDPFEELELEKGVILVHHSGGSRGKWAYNHKYRLKDTSWVLIGATTNYFTPCESFESIDYNLLNNKVFYKKGIQKCNGKGEHMYEKVKVSRTFNRKPSDSLNFEYFNVAGNSVILPDSLGRISF